MIDHKYISSFTETSPFDQIIDLLLKKGTEKLSKLENILLDNAEILRILFIKFSESGERIKVFSEPEDKHSREDLVDSFLFHKLLYFQFCSTLNVLYRVLKNFGIDIPSQLNHYRIRFYRDIMILGVKPGGFCLVAKFGKVEYTDDVRVK